MYSVEIGGTVEHEGDLLVHVGSERTALTAGYDDGDLLTEAMEVEHDETGKAVYLVGSRGNVIEWIDETGTHHLV